MHKPLLLALLTVLCLPFSCLAQAPTPANGVPAPGITIPGQPIDPTKNVLDLVGAAIKRQDDLRDAAERYNDSERRKVSELREQADKYTEKINLVENARLDQLRAAESRRVDEEAKIRTDDQDKLQIAESKRIDAIRAVDVGAVAVASERATQQATVLANQVTASADALRALVATTATTFATQQQLLQTQVTERLSALEKGSYQNTGRASVSDPQLEKLNALVERLATAQATGSGQSAGIGSSVGLLMGVAGLIIAGIAIVMSRRSKA